MPDLLATPAQLASYLQQPLAGLDAATVDLALAGATAEVQDATGQRLVRVTDDQVTLYAIRGRTTLALPQLPVVSVVSVTANSYPVTGWTVEDGSLWRESGWFGLQGAVSAEFSRVTVVYTHGFATIPQRLVDVTLRLAAERYATPTGGVVVSSQIDDYAERPVPIPGGREPGRLSLAERAQLRSAYGVGSVSLVAL